MTQNDISRVETGLGTHGQSIETLNRIVRALGYELKLVAVPREEAATSETASAASEADAAGAA